MCLYLVLLMPKGREYTVPRCPPCEGVVAFSLSHSYQPNWHFFDSFTLRGEWGEGESGQN